MRYWLCELLAVLILLAVSMVVAVTVDAVFGAFLTGEEKFVIGFLIGVFAVLIGYYPVREYLWSKYGDKYR